MGHATGLEGKLFPSPVSIYSGNLTPTVAAAGSTQAGAKAGSLRSLGGIVLFWNPPPQPKLLSSLWSNPLTLWKLVSPPAAYLGGKSAAKYVSATEKIIAKIDDVAARLKTSVYNHNTKVDIAKGQFEFDCSGMVNWLLQEAAPTAYAELKVERPRVIEYVKALKAIPYDKPSSGWRRVKKIEDAEPGDVIAWPTPDWYPSDASGHMGIVYGKPEKVSGGYLIRIADATSYPHGEDSREGGTGFGFGTILITVDPDTGEGTGQGWTGRYSANTVIKTPIYVGRPLK